MTSDVEIDSVRFTYSTTRATAHVTFGVLLENTEIYTFQVRGRGGHVWSANWSSRQDPMEPGTTRQKVFTHFFWPGESATKRRCKVRWGEDVPAATVTVSIPNTCLTVKGKPVKRLRMSFVVTDHYNDAYVTDLAPGGNSYNGGAGKFTVPIRRG